MANNNNLLKVPDGVAWHTNPEIGGLTEYQLT